MSILKKSSEKLSRFFSEYSEYRYWVRRSPNPGSVHHNLPFPLHVSLTSYPARFPFLAAVLTPLLSQTVRPDSVVLWVSYDDAAQLPASVVELQQYGLVIRKCDDLRSYKKLVPALQRDPSCGIITVDDDKFYPGTLVQELVEAYRTPEEVLCTRAHEVTVDEKGAPLPYRSWLKDTPELGPSRFLFPTGVGGVLYPPGIFDDLVTRASVFQVFCPTADDIWFFWCASRAGARFRRIEVSRKPTRVWSSQRGGGLWRVNNRGGGNDRQVAAMLEEFGVPWPE